MMSSYSKFTAFTNRHRVVRGMISYAILWPLGCVVQQTMQGKNYRTYDYRKCLRYGVYGAFVNAPVLYMYMRQANIFFPKRNLRHSLTKALGEQIFYDPIAIILFLFVMSLLEDKRIEEAKEVVKTKFVPTYQSSIIYWPVVQTVNFAFVPQKNQVVFTSFFSMMWTSILSYVNTLDSNNMPSSLMMAANICGRAANGITRLFLGDRDR